MTGGTHYWKMAGLNESPPLVAHGKIVLLATDAQIVALDIDTGKERWSVAEPFKEQPINKVYLGPLFYALTGDTSKVSEGWLYGINPESGAIAWAIPMHSRNSIRDVIDGVVYVKTSFLRNSLIALDGLSGEQLGTPLSLGIGAFTNESYEICSGPVRSGERLLLSTSLQLFAGETPSRGYLYSVAVPARKPK